jgi:hypothetical protein
MDHFQEELSDYAQTRRRLLITAAGIAAADALPSLSIAAEVRAASNLQPKDSQ